MWSEITHLPLEEEAIASFLREVHLHLLFLAVQEVYLQI